MGTHTPTHTQTHIQQHKDVVSDFTFIPTTTLASSRTVEDPHKGAADHGTVRQKREVPDALVL